MPSVNAGPASTTTQNVQAMMGVAAGMTTPITRSAEQGLRGDESGAIIVTTDAAPTTLYVIGKIQSGWNAMVIQGGAGQITLAGAAGVTLLQAAGLAATAAQYSGVSLYAIADDQVVMAGDMQ
ncbi:MAG: hypothetical protein IT325_09915 [Anaerolineae bacterium]|nr:hypothetical protein [Anaerolineae bacterium]